MVNPDEARHQIVKGIEISLATIAQAKTYVVRYCQEVTETTSDVMTGELLRRMGFTSDPFVNFVSFSDIDSDLRRVSQYLTWYSSIREAVCALVHDNVLVLWGDTLALERPVFRFLLPNGDGWWEFPELSIAIPHFIKLAPSVRLTAQNSLPAFLSDADLFLSELGVPGLPQPIVKSLRESLTCFRYDLYTPCLAMLGQAIEGAIGQLGMALAELAYAESRAQLKGQPKTEIDTIRNRVPNSTISLNHLIDLVARVYSNRELFEHLWEEVDSDIPGAPNIVREIASWAHQVRDSRNVIHYGHTSSTRNTFEKVAVLLMDAIPRLRQIYRIHAAAVQMASRALKPADDCS